MEDAGTSSQEGRRDSGPRSRDLSSMPISIHGQYANPKKSPWNFEKYQSDLERRMMDRLERDPHVVKWMKRHGITIPWIDGQKHQRRYLPDFLVEYEDGT